MRRPLTLPEALRYAGQLISTFGWLQKAEGSFTDGFCVVEAIGIAAGVSTARELDMKLCLVVALELPPAEHFIALMTWNDSPKRTKYQVLAALEKAAVVAEEKMNDRGYAGKRTDRKSEVANRR